MNKEQILAEKAFYTGSKLTSEEIDILKHSIYKNLVNIIEPPVSCERLFEDVEAALDNPVVEDIDQPINFKPKKHYNKFNTDLSKINLRELVLDIENKFNLDLSNFSPSKYRTIDIDALRTFINDYKNKHVFDMHTANYLADLIDNKEYSVYDILYRLYIML